MEIKPYAKNPKRHPEEQLKQIANSLRAFGWRQPIVVDKNEEIIVGHGRWFAYEKFPEGIKEPWIVKADDLTEEQVKAYRLADNKLNESDWDMDLAIEELKELSPEMFDLTGFDPDLLIEPDAQDDVIPQDAPPKAQIGQIWQMGNHRIVCGDSTDSEAVAKLMNGRKADMVFTDPPYNINYKGQGENTSDGIMSDNQGTEEFEQFLIKSFKNYKGNLKAGAGMYVFHASRTQAQFEKALQENDYEIKNQLIWNKPMGVMSWGHYRYKHEPFFYAGRKGNEIQFYGDRTNTTVWDFNKTDTELLNWAKKQKRMDQEGKTTIWSMKRENVNDYVHPTQKPVELIGYALRNSTKEEDIVMDLFLGSGSTLIACEKMGRICYGMELDPKYVDVIIKRWEDFTEQKAVLIQ